MQLSGVDWQRAKTRAIACFALGFVAAMCQAAELDSRYGVVKAQRGSAKSGSFNLTLDDKMLATLEAEDITFFRITPNGVPEYILVETWMPGLNCQKAYLLLSISPDKSTVLSPSFGQCMELQAAAYLKNGVKLTLQASNSATPVKERIANFTWVNGKLVRK